MTLKEILPLIISVFTLLGFLFAAYKFFRDPDIKADKSIDLLKEKLKSAEALNMETIKTMQNCLHTLTSKVEKLDTTIIDQGKELTKLSTIIEERIPKKV